MGQPPPRTRGRSSASGGSLSKGRAGGRPTPTNPSRMPPQNPAPENLDFYLTRAKLFSVRTVIHDQRRNPTPREAHPTPPRVPCPFPTQAMERRLGLHRSRPASPPVHEGRGLGLPLLLVRAGLAPLRVLSTSFEAGRAPQGALAAGHDNAVSTAAQCCRSLRELGPGRLNYSPAYGACGPYLAYEEARRLLAACVALHSPYLVREA